MDFVLDNKNRPGVDHQTTESLSELPARNGAEETSYDDVPIQFIAHCDRPSRSVDPNWNSYFGLKEDELFQLLSATPGAFTVLFFAYPIEA